MSGAKLELGSGCRSKGDTEQAGGDRPSVGVAREDTGHPHGASRTQEAPYEASFLFLRIRHAPLSFYSI